MSHEHRRRKEVIAARTNGDQPRVAAILSWKNRFHRRAGPHLVEPVGGQGNVNPDFSAHVPFHGRASEFWAAPAWDITPSIVVVHGTFVGMSLPEKCDPGGLRSPQIHRLVSSILSNWQEWFSYA